MIFQLMQFAFHCISRRQLVGVGVDTVQGSFRFRRHTEAEFGAALSASALRHQKGDLTRRECSEALAIDGVSRLSGLEDATSIRTAISGKFSMS